MNTHSGVLDKISFYCLAAAVALLPVFILPFYQPDVAKFILLSFGAGLSFIFWVIARLIDGQLRAPLSWTLVGLKLAVIAALIAGLASPAARVSLLGQGFESQTFAALVVFLLAAVLASVHFHRKNFARLYVWFMGSFLLASLFELAIVFFGKLPWFAGSFVRLLPPNIEGSLNSLAILAGLVIVLALTALGELHLRFGAKAALWVTVALGLFFLIIANFPLGWLLTAIFALFIFIRQLAFQEEVFKSQSAGEPDLKFARQPRRFPTGSFIVLLICLFLLLGGGLIGSSISNFFGVSNLETRLSLPATLEVAKPTLHGQWIWGHGPNRFAEAWLAHHPAGLNATVLWDTIFPSSFSWLTDVLIAAGLIGLLAWLVFVFFYLKDIWRSFKLQASADHLSNYFLLSSLLASLYLWAALFIYTPALIIVALAFIFTGLMTAALYESGKLHVFSVNTHKRRWPAVVFALVLTAMLVGALYGGFAVARNFAAAVHYSMGLRSITANSLLTESERHLIKAANLGRDSVYLRALSSLYLGRLEFLIKNPKNAPGGEDGLKDALRQTAAQAEQAALQATVLNRTYLNFMNQGLVYEALLSLGADGAYRAAQTAYENAKDLNPVNPLPLLSLARVEAAVKNIPRAKALAEEAIKLKPDLEGAQNLLDSLKETPAPAVSAVEQ